MSKTNLKFFGYDQKLNEVIFETASIENSSRLGQNVEKKLSEVADRILGAWERCYSKSSGSLTGWYAVNNEGETVSVHFNY